MPTILIAQTILDQPPSCIEFSPTHPDLFVVGTYLLESTGEGDGGGEDAQSPSGRAQKRRGSLLLFGLQGERLYVPRSLPP